MASSSTSEAELTLLSGAELVVHLRNTYRMSDFEAVARVLDERDRRNAKVEAALEAALAELDALRKKCEALLDAHRRSRDKAEEMRLLVGAAAPDPVHRDESPVEEAKEREVKGPDIVDLCSDDEEEEEEMAVGPCKVEQDSEEDEEDSEPLSQRYKRLRITPEDSKVGACVRGRRVVKPEKFDGEMPRTMLLPSPGLLDRSALQKGSSKSDHGKAGIGTKEGSSDSVPAKGVCQPPKRKTKMNKTPMVESLAECGIKEVGADMQKCQSLLKRSEEGSIAREGVPFEPCNGKSTSVRVKRERNSLPSSITRGWESEGHMITSFLDNNNMEICMQALCALYRQGKLTIGNPELRKSSDAFRATKLAEFLLDGDIQGPLIRTPEELENHDATDSSFVQQVALDCSEQLFNIFRNREDSYFC